MSPELLNQDHRAFDDTRFQFEIIKELAASVREQTNQLRDMQAQQTEMLVRLERIEAKEIDERVAVCMTRIEVLEADLNRRSGRDGFIAAIFKSPLVAWIVVVAGIVYTAIKDKI